jgi:hypothetical protein
MDVLRETAIIARNHVSAARSEEHYFRRIVIRPIRMSIGRNSMEDGIVFPISDTGQRNGSRIPKLFLDQLPSK